MLSTQQGPRPNGHLVPLASSPLPSTSVKHGQPLEQPGATFILGIAHGGSAGVVYGLVLIVVIYAGIALSMSELAAQYPTTGGQYHWSYLIAPVSARKELVSTFGNGKWTFNSDNVL